MMEKQDVIAALAALAQESRLDIFRALVQAGGAGHTPSALSSLLQIPSATLSFHLKELKSAGVVACRREGRSLIYTPNFATMNDLLGFLTENCCEGVGGCADKAAANRS